MLISSLFGVCMLLFLLYLTKIAHHIEQREIAMVRVEDDASFI
jgi:hypothetical protein